MWDRLALGTQVRSRSDVQLSGRQIRPNHNCAEKEPGPDSDRKLGAGGTVSNKKEKLGSKEADGL